MKKKKNVKAAYDAYCEASLEDFHDLRDDFFNAVESNGFDGTLEALGFPTERKTLWFNVHTGCEAPLEGLLGERHELTSEIEELGYVLEHWLPKKEHPNPIIGRSLALSEEDVLRQVVGHIRVYMERCATAEEFEKSFRNQGGTMDDGGYSAEKGKVSVRLHDGREFIFGAKSVFAFAEQEKRQATLF
jgi:hypothetical protein